ncbi:hypothetical protein F5B20DRAFT_596690 [Whalleya microplaca]|nr:hypothetical protein F5B20DRAFT_596690 [Whalleya microplaca]
MSAQLPPDVDRAVGLMTVWWIEYGVASVFIFLRLWARRCKRSLGLDDAVMGITWACFLGDAVLTTTAVTSIVDIFLNLFRCGDPRATWDYELAATAKCLNSDSTDAYNTFTNAWQVLSDFCFSILPIVVVCKLHMPLRRKLTIIAALGLTLVTGAAAAVKAVLTGSLDHADLTWSLYATLIWFGTEAMLIIVCSSIPTLHPLWERFVRRPGLRYESQRSGYLACGNLTPGRSKASKLRTQDGESLTMDNDSMLLSDIELACLTGNPQQLSTSVATTPHNVGTWVDDLGHVRIHVVKQVDVVSGRPHWKHDDGREEHAYRPQDATRTIG